MAAGLTINEWKGREGRILVPGLGAVLATFAEWTLSRAATTPDGEWGLRGSLSYLNEVLIRQEALPLRIQIRWGSSDWRFLSFDRAALVIEHMSVRCTKVMIDEP